MKSAAEMLMRILQAGGTVEHQGTVWGMSDDGSMLAKYGDRWIDCNCDIKAFVVMAERIGRDELWLKCCAMQLSNLKTRKAKD